MPLSINFNNSHQLDTKVQILILFFKLEALQDNNKLRVALIVEAN